MGGASTPPLFSEKAVNIINTYTFILGAKYFSPSPPPNFLHASSTTGQLTHCTSDAYCVSTEVGEDEPDNATDMQEQTFPEEMDPTNPSTCKLTIPLMCSATRDDWRVFIQGSI